LKQSFTAEETMEPKKQKIINEENKNSYKVRRVSADAKRRVFSGKGL